MKGKATGLGLRLFWNNSTAATLGQTIDILSQNNLMGITKSGSYCGFWVALEHFSCLISVTLTRTIRIRCHLEDHCQRQEACEKLSQGTFSDFRIWTINWWTFREKSEWAVRRLLGTTYLFIHIRIHLVQFFYHFETHAPSGAETKREVVVLALS